MSKHKTLLAVFWILTWIAICIPLAAGGVMWIIDMRAAGTAWRELVGIAMTVWLIVSVCAMAVLYVGLIVIDELR